MEREEAEKEKESPRKEKEPFKSKVVVPDYKMGPTPLEIIERIRDRDPVDLVANLVTLRKQADDMKEKALKAYSFATHKAERFLVPAHPVRLSIALNFGVF